MLLFYKFFADISRFYFAGKERTFMREKDPQGWVSWSKCDEEAFLHRRCY